jgi:predicted nuclease of restriction endonuclease-like (RecB) superfamily
VDGDDTIGLTCNTFFRIRAVQIKAALSVNSELLRFYWSLGVDIAAKQTTAKWGDGLLSQLSRDLTAEFPEMKGFSLSNLKYIKQWYLFYARSSVIGQQAVGQTIKPPASPLQQDEFVQQVVEQISAIPWGHNIAIVAKCKDVAEAIYYVQNTLAHNWSRSVLVHQIESGFYQREGRSVTNFAVALPKTQSDLAKQVLKDPYIFDFLSMTKEYNERDLEKSLIEHITQFLLRAASTPEGCFPPCSVCTFLPSNDSLPFNLRTWPGLQTAKIGLNATLVAGTLQLIGHNRGVPGSVPGRNKNARIRDSGKALPAYAWIEPETLIRVTNELHWFFLKAPHIFLLPQRASNCSAPSAHSFPFSKKYL